MSGRGKFALAVVLAHLGIAILHGRAHQSLFIGLSLSQEFFIWTVIIVAPLIAALLLILKSPRVGGLLLFLSMAGSLLFGVWAHFLVPGADNVASTPHTAWGTAFRLTANLLLLTEALGCGLGISLLR
jgi:hypothetical protein